MIHSKMLAILLLLSLPLSFTGCGSLQQDLLWKDRAAYFTFTGNTEGALVTVTRDGEPVWTEMKVDPEESYIIEPDCYEVLVIREGKVALQRIIILGKGLTFEILIP